LQSSANYFPRGWPPILSRLRDLAPGQPSEDYPLTNKYVLTDKAITTMSAYLKNYGVTTAPPMESLKPLPGVEPQYLEATSAAIETEHGSFDEFRRKSLGLTDADRQSLSSML